jgi:glycosyltransferase involved in cell wall biosynthesis
MVYLAVVHEWLVTHAGSEQVVEHILNQYPTADLYSLVDFLPDDHRHFIQHKSVHTSFIQRLPLARRHFRQYLPLMPIAIEQFDLSDYELVVSSSHAVAKGALTRADQLHISYVHTPIRYAWDLHHQYLKEAKLTRGMRAIAARSILHYLRLWDLATANRVDAFVANSRYVARRIWKTYRRPATVIYPPVAIDRFRPDRPRDEFYLTVSRFVPYKRVDLIVQAFAQLGRPLVVIGDGDDRAKIEAMATPNITFLGSQPNPVVTDYMERCKAFVFAAEEDFGITPVEAQAAGAPVIAYGKGGVTETIVPGKTGCFFPLQTPDSLAAAVQQFEDEERSFEPEILRQQAERFAPERFRTEFSAFVDQKWSRFRQGDDIE